jgi:hypothetical protein
MKGYVADIETLTEEKPTFGRCYTLVTTCNWS